MGITEVLSKAPLEIPGPHKLSDKLGLVRDFMNPENRVKAIEKFIETHRKPGMPAIVQNDIPGMQMVLVGDGKLGKELLQNNSLKRASVQTNMAIVLGETILTTENDRWREKRRIVNEFINKDSGKTFYEDITTTIDTELDTWTSKIKSGKFHLVKEVNHVFQKIAQNTILGGYTIPDELSEGAIKLIEHGYKYAMMPQLSLLDLGFQKEKKDVYKKLGAHFKTLLEYKADKPNLLKSLIEKGYTMDEVVGEFIAIYTAAWETTANTVKWGLGEVSNNQEFAENAAQEASDKFVGKEFNEDERPDSSEKIQQLLPYAYATFQYGLMMYPQSPIGLRQATKDIEVGGFRIKKGSMVMISMTAINKDKSVIGEDYDLDTSMHKDLPSFLPSSLSAGAHQCPGGPIALVEGPLFISSVLGRFKVQSFGRLPEPVAGTTLPTPDNFTLKLTPRK